MSDPIPTTCMRCAVGCGHVHQGVDVGVGVDLARGDPAHPTNEGLACGRGLRESTDPDGEWLTRPLVRRGDELVPTTWDVALDVAVTGLRSAAADDPDGVAVLGSGQQTNEAAYALGKFARGAVGTRNYDANTTLCMASAVAAYYDAFGSDAPPPTYDDIPGAETHLLWGANPAVAHPVMFRWIHDSAGDDDSELIVVDPVETKTAVAADQHIAPDPGTDLALARAVLARLIETGGVDDEFVEAHTEGFDTLMEALPEATAAAADAGVEMADVDLLAESLDAPTLLYWGMGVNQHVQGTDTASALVDLCLASGNLGPDSGPFSLTGQANSMGTRVCSSKGTWPGHRDFEDPEARRDVADAWGVPVERLPDDPGPGPVGMLESVGGEEPRSSEDASGQRSPANGEVEAVYAVATNPAAGMPDANAVRESLEGAFLVVQDAFHTETTELADVVLPAATWGESEGTTTNMERTISRVRRVTDPPSGVRTDLELITTIGEALEPGIFSSTKPDAVFEEFAALTRGTLADCSGVSYARLDEQHAIRWPAPDGQSHAGYRYYEGEAAADDDGGAHDNSRAADDSGATDDADDGATWSFPTPSGKARFSAATFQGVAEPVSEAYPLTLTTARERDGYNTGVRSRSTDPDPVTVRVHPESAPVDDGEAVEIASRRGSITATLETDGAVPEGVAWLPIHHPSTNELTTRQRDPTGEPNFKQCAVRLVPVEAEERVREGVPA